MSDPTSKTLKPSAVPVTVATTPRPTLTRKDGTQDRRQLVERHGRKGGITEIPQETKDEALRLIHGGMAIGRAMDAVGVSRGEIYDWAREDADYGARFKIARESLAHAYAGESVTLLEDGSAEDTTEYQRANAHVNLLRARSGAKQWLAGKMLPSEYGEKIEHRGQINHAVILLPPLDPPVAIISRNDNVLPNRPQNQLGAAVDVEVLPEG